MPFHLSHLPDPGRPPMLFIMFCTRVPGCPHDGGVSMDFELVVVQCSGLELLPIGFSRGMRVTSGHPGCGASCRDETRVCS